MTGGTRAGKPPAPAGAMQRIVVIGCSGSGKSTLARRLGEKTGLPVVHLDTLYWQPGWKDHPDMAAFRAQVRAIERGERWIIDGGFTSGSLEHRLARADTVVLFDLPTWLCLFRAVRRVVHYWGRTRPDLAPGCPEKFDLEFYNYIRTYRRTKLPQLEADIGRLFKGRFVRIRNEPDRHAFLADVERLSA